MFKKLIKTILVALLALAVQTMLLPPILGENYTPNLVTMLVVFFAMHHTNQFGLFAIFVLGLLVDLSYAEILGIWTSTYLVIFAVVLLLSQQLFVESKTVVFFSVFLFSLASEFVYLTGIGKLVKADLRTFWEMSVSCFVAALIATFVFKTLKKFIPDGDSRKRF